LQNFLAKNPRKKKRKSTLDDYVINCYYYIIFSRSEMETEHERQKIKKNTNLMKKIFESFFIDLRKKKQKRYF
jgi:hypothetical protein